MIGSLSMAGAGVATATDYDKSSDGKEVADFCVNNNEVSNQNSSGLVNALNGLNIAILGTASPTNAVQQSCAVDHSAAVNDDLTADQALLELLGG
ncbi:hypothetical protein [Streptomyces sp. NPDC002328]|uniref:hypothetical protein n=1 Tax=Streptomyces sp. NPDC002328 TaxID=3364642 RepID=UPI0036B9B633